MRKRLVAFVVGAALILPAADSGVAQTQDPRPVLAFITQRTDDVDAGSGANDLDIRILDSAGSVSAPINPPNIYPRFFSFSPDGSQIAFMGHAYGCAPVACQFDESLSIYTMNVDGTGLKLIYRPDASIDFMTFPEWSPDGNRIMFVVYPEKDEKGRTPNSDIWVLTQTAPGVWTPSPFITRRGDEKWPDWSPDGKYVAYEYHPDKNGYDDKGESQRAVIGISPADGSGPHRGIGKGFPISHPTFSPDGKRIAYVDYPSPWASDGSSVGIMRIDGTGERTLAGSLKYPWALDFSPDGTEVAFGEGWKWDSTRVMAVAVRRPHAVRVVVDEPTVADHLPKYFPVP